MTKTRNEWMRTLPRSYCEALAELHNPDDRLTANEVLESVVGYFGGVATGCEIRSLIKNIYEVDLEEVAQ